MAITKQKHEATINLSAHSLKSLEKAQAAIKAALEEMVLADGYEVIIKVKSDYDLSDELRQIQGILEAHRGVYATITSKVKKELEPNDDALPWDKTPMGQALASDSDQTPAA